MNTKWSLNTEHYKTAIDKRLPDKGISLLKIGLINRSFVRSNCLLYGMPPFVSLFEQLKIVSVVSDHKNGQSSFKMVSWGRPPPLNHLKALRPEGHKRYVQIRMRRTNNKLTEFMYSNLPK